MASSLKRIENPGTLKERAYKVLKNAIMAHELEPGKIYSVPELAKQLGISRSPVREALLELAVKGFIKFHSRRGVKINILTETDIRHLVTFRGIIERSVVENITARDLSDVELRSIVEAHSLFVAAVEKRDILQFIETDRQFHALLASLTGNPYFIAALENIRDLIDWTNLELIREYDRTSEALEEHQAIFDRIMAKDGPGAAEKMDRHLRIALNQLLKHRVKPEIN